MDTLVFNFDEGTVFRRLKNGELKRVGKNKQNQINVNFKIMCAHRLLYEAYHGVVLKKEEIIKHKDGNNSNNKINNLYKI